MNDLRFALRQLAKSPGFTAVAVSTLAVGIGACAAIFSVMNSVLSKPLPMAEPERLVVVQEGSPTAASTTVATGKYIAWRQQAASFEDMGALFGQSYNLTGAGDPVHLQGGRITASLLATLRLAPALGRNFLPEEERPFGREDVAILGHGLWQARFGGRPDVLHQTIQLSGRPFTIVGVMPRDSGLPEKVQLYTPLGFSAVDRSNFGVPYLHVVGRLKPGRTPAEAQAEMSVIFERMAREAGAPSPTSRGWDVRATPLIETIVGNVRPVLWSLLGAVGFLLLMACANLASLLLARASARTREIAVRAALGASRGRIIRQLLVESTLLAIAGGALGLLFAHSGLAAVVSQAPEALPRAGEISLDPRGVVVTLGVVVLSAVGFGLAPAFQASQVRLGAGLKQAERGAVAAGPRQRVRSALIVGQVAIALVLLAGAGLLMRSFVRLQELNPGFNPRDAHVADIFLPRPQYLTHEQYVGFAQQVMADVAAQPEVRAVAVANNLPFSQHHFTYGMTTRVVVPGRPPDGEAPTVAHESSVSPDYFGAMGIPLLAGRPFDGRDVAAGQPVVVISQSVARRLFPTESAVGKSLRMLGGPAQVVGIVGDVKQSSLQAAAGLHVYKPFLQSSDNDMLFVVRTAGPAGQQAAATALRRAIARADAAVPIYNAQPLAALMGASIARQQLSMMVFALFSMAALVLAAIGIYGVIAHDVTRRTGEIGIRMALGARGADVVRLVLVQVGKLLGLGVLAGLAGALLLTRFLERLVFQIGTHDPVTYLGTVLILTLTAAGACLLPTRRATQVSPMTALRAD